MRRYYSEQAVLQARGVALTRGRLLPGSAPRAWRDASASRRRLRAAAGATNNACTMVAPGSVRARHAGLPAPLAPLAVLLGVAAMRATVPATMGLGLGLRPTLVLAELLLVVPGLALLALVRAPVAEALGLRALRGRAAALCLVAGATLWTASLGLFALQYLVWPPPEGYIEAFRRLHAALRPTSVADALVSVAAIAVVPALCEEALFRGIVLGALRPAAGPWLAVAVQAFLFALIHLDATAGGPPVTYRVPFTFAVGLALGALRLRTGSLAGPALAHAALNTITFLVVLFSGDPARDTDPGPLLGLSLLAGGSVATALVLRALGRLALAPRIDSPAPAP